MILQAGDTVLTKTDSIPKDAELQKGVNILHLGNTGNHHKFVGGSFGIYKKDESKFVEVVETTSYEHEEHKPIVVPPGIYALSFVQEWDHFGDLKRSVVD